jgi:hypothetical protein
MHALLAASHTGARPSKSFSCTMGASTLLA